VPTRPQINARLDEVTQLLGLNPQEQNLYRHHLGNLVGPGGVDQPNGARSTVLQMSFERNDRTYNIPTVWNGKVLEPDEAIKRATASGLNNFPSYRDEDTAEARYQRMHAFMNEDVRGLMQEQR
jgi:hypothetical protein